MTPPLSVTPVPGQGLRLDLSACWKLSAVPAERDFWAEEAQALLRSHLGEFLPAATPDGHGGVLYQIIENGKEIASQSRPLREDDALPAYSLARLRKALHRLESHGENPLQPKTERLLLQAFRLPNPAVDPELFRVHGAADDLRLLILWGVEGEPDSAVPLQEILSLLPVLPAQPVSRLRKVVLGIAALAAFAVAAIFGRRAMREWEEQSARPKIVTPDDVATFDHKRTTENRTPEMWATPPPPAPSAHAESGAKPK